MSCIVLFHFLNCIYFLWMKDLPTCMYIMCMSGVHRGQNRASDPLVDLEMVVRRHRGTGDQSGSSGKATSALNY